MNHSEVNQAADLLHELLQTQTRLAEEKAEENRLERLIVDQKQRELELQDKQLAMEREVENRREARLNEILQRLVRSDEQMQGYVNKLVTTDDVFGETVQRVIDTQRAFRDTLLDCLRALHVILSRNPDDLRQTRPLINSQIELLQYQDNLDKLRLDAARYGSLDVPLKLQNEIERTEKRIEELTARIAAQRGDV